MDGGAVRYRYDARGERAETVAAGVVTDRVAGPGANALLLNGSGQLEREEIWAAGERVATYTTAAQPGGSDNTIVSYADARGTVHLQLPVAAAPAITCSNLPFGDNLSCTGNSDPLPSPLHFTGKPRDPETGLDDFGARLYSSSLGRWMTPDWSEEPENIPFADLRNPQSLDLYTYVLNNPVSDDDPDGHMRCTSITGSDGQFTFNCVPDRQGGSVKDLGSLLWTSVVRWWRTDARSPSPTDWQELLKTRPLTGTVAPEGELEQAAKPIAEDAAADLAKLGAKYNINSTSAFGQQILKNLQMTCEEFISTFRKASIRGEFPEESLERTVGEALKTGGKLRKLLVDSRFAK